MVPIGSPLAVSYLTFIDTIIASLNITEVFDIKRVFNNSFLSPKNYPFSFGILTPHLIRNSLGPCKPITYGIPVGFAFLHSSLQNAPTFYNGLPLHHKNVSSHGEIWTPI